MRGARYIAVGLVATVCLLGMLASASAAVVSADDPRFGPGSITVDLTTGYQWLDVTLSANRSIADVSAQFGPGGDFEGFRYATQAEVIQFFENAGLSVGFGFASAPYQVFTGLVGLTSPGTNPERTVGWVSTQSSPGQYFAPDVGTFLPASGSSGFANPNNCCVTATQAFPIAGSWLVRTVVSADDPRFGVGAITIDLTTGYHWLDVTLSANRSIADVSAQFGPGGDFEGFRYATQAEVTQFFQNAGLGIGFGFPSAPYQVFTGLVGLTSPGTNPQRTVGRVSTQSSPGQYFAPDVGTFLPASGSSGFANPNNCCAIATQANPDAGSWLVRTVVSADDPRFGAGAITIDLITGYQWLDVTLSANRSIADVSAQFGLGGDFEGFRYATQAEVTQFFQDAGLSIGFGFPSAPYQVFTGLVGLTSPGTSPERTVGWVSTQSSSGQYFAPDVGTFLPASGSSGFANPNNCCVTATQAFPTSGSWLVRIPGGEAPTPVGSNVAVNPVAVLPDGSLAIVTVSFDEIDSAGATTVTASETGSPAPAGFKLGSPPVYYDVSTTATFTGSVTVCFTWAEGQFTNESSLRLFHEEGGVWTDVTSSVDTQNNEACGMVTSLSPFAMFEVVYQFSGFFPPVNNSPTLNAVKAGAGVPVKFSLGGNHGLAVLSAGYPRSQAIGCSTTVSVDSIEETVTAGSSGLTYDEASDQYVYVWKTDKSWAGTCRRFMIRLNDGSDAHVAEFKFNK